MRSPQINSVNKEMNQQEENKLDQILEDLYRDKNRLTTFQKNSRRN